MLLIYADGRIYEVEVKSCTHLLRWIFDGEARTWTMGATATTGAHTLQFLPHLRVALPAGDAICA
jgi:hypothetical protein